MKDSFEREYILNLDMIVIMCLRFHNEESLWGMYWSILSEPQFIHASRGLRVSQYFNFYFQNYIHVPLWLSHPETREHSRIINYRHCAIAFRGRQSSWCWEWVKVSWQQARQAGPATTAQLQSSDRVDSGPAAVGWGVESKAQITLLQSATWSGSTKRSTPLRRGGPRGRRSGGSTRTESLSSWRSHPKPVLEIWTRKSTWCPLISLSASSTSSSGRGSVSAPRTRSSSSSITWFLPPLPPWGRCIRLEDGNNNYDVVTNWAATTTTQQSTDISAVICVIAKFVSTKD